MSVAGSTYRPIRVLDVEIGGPLSPIEPSAASDGRQYERALGLVRLHGVPLGYVPVGLEEGRLSPSAIARAVWESLSGEINAHLAEDGCPAICELDADGVPGAGRAPCSTSRDAFLEDPPFVSVVVPTRDRPEVVRQCLDSIFTATYPPSRLEVVIVDNAPRGPETVALVRELATEHPVRYVREDVSGSASARNRGICASEGKLLLFTDDDVWVDAMWLAETAHAFQQLPDVAAVTGMVVPRELETWAQALFEQYGGFTVGGLRRRAYNIGNPAGEEGPLYPYAAGIYGTGNNMAFERDALIDLGGFDPALGNGTPARGGVDSEALLRTVLAGHTLVVEPRSVVRHRHRADYDGLRRQLHSYGVGLGAYLLKTMIYRPRSVVDLVSRAPAMVRYAFDGSSARNSSKGSDFPRDLNRAELLGLAYSPVAYARSRLRYGPHRAPLPCRPKG